jgi:hypothetical protein
LHLPTSAKDIGAYLSTLSDEEVLILARRREQELRVLQSKLGQLVQATTSTSACLLAMFLLFRHINMWLEIQKRLMA